MSEKLKDAGVGYRILKVGEIIRKGDEYFNSSTESWIDEENSCIKFFGCPVSNLKYRRPIKSTSSTSANSRKRKCPHCGKVIKAGTTKRGKRGGAK